MEKPRFEKTGETDGGYPIYERTRESRSEQSEAQRSNESDPTEPKLSKQQRQSLRLALALVGAMLPTELNKQTDDTSMHDRPPIESVEPDQDMTTDRAEEAKEEEAKETKETDVTEDGEGIEVPTLESDYERIRAVHQTKFRLRHDAVQMVSADNRLVGEPISFNENELGLADGYQGQTNDAGIATEGIAGQWLDAAREHVQAQHPETEIERLIHANEEFRKVYDPDRFPELVAKIDAGEVDTIEDITAYFIEQPFGDETERNRYEYAIDEVTFRNEELVIPIEGGEVVRRAVSPAAQDTFRSLLPGLLAHESNYRDDLTSSEGAKGAAQIIPPEWQRVTGEAEVDTDFARQIAVWGEIMSDNYNSAYERISGPALETLAAQFDDLHEFDAEFMPRLAFLAYNTGPQRMAELVEAYVALTPVERMPHGLDLFADMLAFGEQATSETHGEEFALLDQFQHEAAGYVPAAEAKALALAERFGNVEDSAEQESD